MDPQQANILKRFRLLAVRIAIGATGLLAIVLYAVDPPASLGILGGGLAGILIFWYSALQFAKAAERGGTSYRSLTIRLTTLSLLLYSIVLYWAYQKDPAGLHGVFGAAAGLFIIRGVAAFLGLTGLDLKGVNDSNGKHR